MKTLYALTIFFFSAASLAAESPQGNFVFHHDVAFGGGYTEKTCRKEKGTWKDGACYFGTADMVTVAREPNAEWNVKVETIRTNGRTCEFVGRAKAVSRNELLASMDSEEVIRGNGPDEYIYVPTQCELKITYIDENTIQVRKLDHQKCEYICAYASGLEVPAAKRFRR